jgi:hypothetical protein
VFDSRKGNWNNTQTSRFSAIRIMWIRILIIFPFLIAVTLCLSLTSVSINAIHIPFVYLVWLYTRDIIMSSGVVYYTAWQDTHATSKRHLFWSHISRQMFVYILHKEYRHRTPWIWSDYLIVLISQHCIFIICILDSYRCNHSSEGDVIPSLACWICFSLF